MCAAGGEEDAPRRNTQGRHGAEAGERLTADGLAAIQATAFGRRPGRGGRLESAQAAEVRGRLDIAIISLMRDAMLRVSEGAALTWGDIKADPDEGSTSVTDTSGGAAVLGSSSSSGVAQLTSQLPFGIS